ncbi:MAG: heparinase II/III family protein [Clostridia bacterium]|nr:heparinase II/III family protein [Clostridia bacterium]
MQKKLSFILTIVFIISLLPVSFCYAEDTYLCTKLELSEFSYDPTEGVVSAYAQLIQYESNQSQQTAPPTSGTVVIAAYHNDTLVAVNVSSYSDLSTSMSHEVRLSLPYVENVYVKAFLVDSIDNLTPLTISKECTDVEKLIVYDDIITDEDTTIKRLHTFEEDKLAYSKYVASYAIQKYANCDENSITVTSDANGNNYLSVKTGAQSTSHPFVVFDCGSLQKLVVEFDVQHSDYSVGTFYLYDSANSHNISCLTIDKTGVLSSNSTVVGSLNKTGWTRVKMVIDNSQKQIGFYVGDSLNAVNVPMVSDNLTDIRALRIYERIMSGYDTELMLDNIVVYSGNKLYDFSKTISGEIDKNTHVYNHNIAGLNEFFDSFTAIHTVTGKLCDVSVTKCSKLPELRDGVLYVAETDAAKLVRGSQTSSQNMVALDTYAAAHGKKVTYTKTNTVIVGDKKAVLSDEMTKLINSHLTYDRPTADELIETMGVRNVSRPYLTLTRENLERIKTLYSNGTDKYISNWCAEFIKDANSYLNKSVMSFVDYDGDQSDRIHVIAATIKERVQKLSLAYHLTGEDKYAERAWTEIENACSFPHWHQGINELDSSGMASAVAYGYDWLYDYWLNSDPNRLKIMENAIFEKHLNWAQECYHGMRPYGWAVTQNNWNAACNGDTALAACSIYNADTKKCADIIANAIGCSEAALKEFYPNGAWKEGTSYWAGTVQVYSEMFSTLNNFFGSYYNLENTEAFDVTANYILSSSGPTGNNSYNDSKPVTSYTVPTMFWFSGVYGNNAFGAARLKQLDDGKSELDVLDLCYYNPDTDYTQGELPLDTYFEQLELVSLRSEWNNPDASYVSFHSGNNLGADAHSHIDSGTFVIDMIGERFASDIGSHYYFSTGHGQAPNVQPDDDGAAITRWDYYHHVPEGHNCFIINPDRTIGQNIVTDDKMERFESGEDTSFAITSLTSAYKGYADNARRGIMLSDSRRCVTVRDEIELSDNDNEIYWYMHKSKDCVFEKIDDSSFYLIKNGKRVKVMFITNADAVSVYEADARHLVREAPAEQEEVTDYNKLVIKLNASKHVYLQVKFIPQDGVADDVTIENIALDTWSVN